MRRSAAARGDASARARRVGTGPRTGARSCPGRVACRPRSERSARGPATPRRPPGGPRPAGRQRMARNAVTGTSSEMTALTQPNASGVPVRAWRMDRSCTWVNDAQPAGTATTVRMTASISDFEPVGAAGRGGAVHAAPSTVSPSMTRSRPELRAMSRIGSASQKREPHPHRAGSPSSATGRRLAGFAGCGRTGRRGRASRRRAPGRPRRVRTAAARSGSGLTVALGCGVEAAALAGLGGVQQTYGRWCQTKENASTAAAAGDDKGD
jgi:hypothetical protein